jgi:hypothetical protein
MKNKAVIFFLLIAVFGCTKKGNNSANIVLSGNLTDCAANSNCSYNYFDNADFTNWNNPVRGSFRVFWYKSVSANVCDATSEFYFKTQLNSTAFDITSDQIAAGNIVGYNLECPCCDIAVLTKPIGGEIKGKRIDLNRWLVNASLVFGTSGKPADTLVVNQYFSQQLLP